METRKIPDSDITASSVYNSYHAPHNARLHKHVAPNSAGGWAAQINDKNQWLQVKFGQRVEIRGVATQGRHNFYQWMTSYSLRYSSDGMVFHHYQTNTKQTVFNGNTDIGTVVSHVLNPPITARYIRVHPVTWHDHISFRVDFYGCFPDPPVPVAVYPLNEEFGTRDLSPNQNEPGTPHNFQLTPGPFGRPNGSYWLSGTSSSYIEFPNDGGLDTRYSFTSLVWVFPENVDGPIVNYGTDNFGVHLWILDNKIFARSVTRLGGLGPVQTKSVQHHAWNFIGFSYDYDIGVQKLWIEGKVYDVLTADQFEQRTQDNIRMGKRDGDLRFFKGRISCLQLYNKALTEREVQAVRGMCFRKVPLKPVAFFPLNGQYETTDISHSQNPPGEASNVELAPGPDGFDGGSYQFKGMETSFITFTNTGGLDTRYSSTFLVWIYQEHTKGPIFYYFAPGYYGVRLMVDEQGSFYVNLRTSQSAALRVLNASVLQEKKWHFIGSSYDYVSGELILWVNGSVHKKVIIDSPAELATQANVTMGGLPGQAGQYSGRFSCFQLYDRVLTESEIENAKQLCSTTGRSDPNQNVYIGEAVDLKCDTLEGKTARWSKDSTVIQERSAGYGTSLVISSVQPPDEGTYTCDIINDAGDIQASYSVTLRVEDPSSLCSDLKAESSSVWKAWSVLPPSNYSREYYEGKWFRAEKGAAMTSSCILEETCGVQAPSWLNGPNPSREMGIIHSQVCMNFRNHCCFHSLPVQIKKCSDFFAYKLQEVHPMIPGRYCFTTNNLDFVDRINNVMFTSSGADRLLNGHKIAIVGSVGNSLQCMQDCTNAADRHCKSFNYRKLTRECQLNNGTAPQERSGMEMKVGYNQYDIAKTEMIIFP